MADTVKFTTEEMQEIQSLQTMYNQCTFNAGRLFIEKQGIEGKEGLIKKMYAEAKQTELDLLQKLNEKYGAGSINLETGEFTPTSELEKPVMEKVED